MKLKFWERKKISASDVAHLDNINNKVQDDIDELERYRSMLCPVVRTSAGCSGFHNKLLRDAITDKIKSLRDYQLKATL